MKVRYTHTVPAPIGKVLDAYRNTEFYERKQKNSGAITVDVFENEELPNGGFRRVARCSEPSRVPKFLRKSEVDTYVDESVLDAAAGTLTWKVTPDKMADVFFLSGKVEFHDRGESTEVVFNVDLTVKIPLVGKKAERIGLEKSEEESDRQAAFLKEWVG